MSINVQVEKLILPLQDPFYIDLTFGNVLFGFTAISNRSVNPN